jgi:hypothetical protein
MEDVAALYRYAPPRITDGGTTVSVTFSFVLRSLRSIRARRGIGQVLFDVQPDDVSTAGSCATALARRHRTGSLGRVEVTGRDGVPLGLHDPRAEA